MVYRTSKGKTAPTLRLVLIIVGCLLAVGVAATLYQEHKNSVQDKRARSEAARNEGRSAQYGQDQSKLPYNPQAALPGGDYTPTPDDVFSPPSAAAETYPGFPAGTRFLAESLTDRLTTTSVQIAQAWYARYRLRPPCRPERVTRYVDPEKQTLARSTVHGCHIFIDVDTPVPHFRKSWNAMGYCNLIVHEYGHSIGLGHSPNPQQMMYFQGNSRGRSGCERFAPNVRQTYPLLQAPPIILCDGHPAARYWLEGKYRKAIVYAQRHAKRSQCPDVPGLR